MTENVFAAQVNMFIKIFLKYYKYIAINVQLKNHEMSSI